MTPFAMIAICEIQIGQARRAMSAASGRCTAGGDDDAPALRTRGERDSTGRRASRERLQ
jgi:hypothetical protein